MTEKVWPIRFELDYGAENPEWDTFVGQCPGAHHEQTMAWAKVKQEQGWQAYRILVRKEGRLLGGAQVLHRRMGWLATLGYIPRGPVSLSNEVAAEVTELVMQALRKTAHTYLAILPNYEWVKVVPVLEASDFFAKPNLLPPSNLITATMVIDLTQDLDSILARMKSKTRQYVRRGQREGVSITLGSEKDLPTFFRLMCQLSQRRGVAPYPSTLEAFRSMWRHLAPDGMVKLFIGRYQSEAVVAAFAFVYGGVIRVWKAGWSGEHDERRPNQLLWWEIINWAKAANLKVLDFEQILPAHAAAILRGETLNDAYWGVTQFKLGFGGDLLVIPNAYYRSYNPCVQALLKLGGAKLLASPLLIRWAGRLVR